MKILGIAQASDKVILAQNEPGTGFEYKIKQDAKEKNVDVINISALKDEIYTTKLPNFLNPRDNSKLDELVADSPINSLPLFEGNKDNLKDGVYTQPLPNFLHPRDNSKLDELVAGSPMNSLSLFKGSGNWPEVKSPTAWIVNDFESLTKEKQVEFFSNLSGKIKENKDLKIIVSFRDPINIAPEVLKNASLVLNASLLPPIGTPVDFSGLPKVDLTTIRRKYHSNDRENKNIPK